MAGGPGAGSSDPWGGISPAILVLVVPLGFRFTCYYYRKAYYRSIWQSPPACAVEEPTALQRRDPLPAHPPERAPLLLLPGLVLNCILTWDAVEAFHP